MTTIAEYRTSQELFANLTLRELRSKYKRSFLGWAWSMINPLVTTVIYTVVFSLFLRAKPLPGQPSGEHLFALYLLCALLPWNFFNAAVNGSVGNLVGNGNLIKKTYFPRELLPASTVAAALVAHLIEMGVFLVVLLAFGDWRALVFLPFTVVIMAVTTVFSLGLSLLFSAVNVYFRDVQHFLAIFFLLWLYGTPIIYPTNYVQYRTGTNNMKLRFIPHTHIQLLTVLKINPMVDMELLMRQTLWDGTFPDWASLLIYVAWAAAALLIGLKVFAKLSGRLAEEL